LTHSGEHPASKETSADRPEREYATGSRSAFEDFTVAVPRGERGFDPREPEIWVEMRQDAPTNKSWSLPRFERGQRFKNAALHKTLAFSEPIPDIPNVFP
jgi:hypothetical protein